MKLTNVIENFIMEMFSNANNGEIELKRNALADKFSCVPSQINYVISTRFSPERGYLVESQRGGGGYIRIARVSVSEEGSKLMHVVNSIGNSISSSTATAIIKNCYDYDLISEREARIIISAISEKSLAIKQPSNNLVRARILKNILVSIA